MDYAVHKGVLMKSCHGPVRSVVNVLRSMGDICSHLNKRDKGSSEAKLGPVQEARQVEPAPHGTHVHPIQRSQEWGKNLLHSASPAMDNGTPQVY